MFFNKSINFVNNFRLLNFVEFISMFIGLWFIDFLGLSVNFIKFGKKFGIFVKKFI